MSAETRRWRIGREVAYEFVGDEAVALNLKTGTYFRLNGVGASAWKHLAKSPDAEGLADRLLREFDVDRRTLVADVTDFLLELEGHGLIVRQT